MVTIHRKKGVDDPSVDSTSEAAEAYRQTRRVQDQASQKSTNPTQGGYLKGASIAEAGESRKGPANKSHRRQLRRSHTSTSSRRRRVRRPDGVSQAAPHYAPGVSGNVNFLHPLLPDLETADVEVSVVFGTYNRLPLLQECVASIRVAVGSLSYEIIVADGGSTDGSAEWLREQDDVLYIEGDLSGAVANFNAAARQAKGEFILALNDDAKLDPDAITFGLKYFDDPLVGQVAFTFFEHGVWKIETVHGEIYANFALTRANIVRASEEIVGGMWATCYSTYGGDTEFSCWVYRFGYKVVAALDAKVIHREYVDGLRRKNIKVDRQRLYFAQRFPSAAHLKFRGLLPELRPPEAEKLTKIQMGETIQERWPRIELADPQRGEHPLRVTPKAERVLQWQLWTAEDPQTSMVQALQGLGSAGYTGIKWPSLQVADRGRAFVEAVRATRPTLVFLQCQDPHAVPVAALKTIREDPDRDPSLVVCVWSGDIGPHKGPWVGSEDGWQFKIASAVDLMLFTGTGQVEHYRARGMANAAYLQIGYDVDRYFSGFETKYGTQHAITFIGQNYGPYFDDVPGSEAQLRRDAVRSLHQIQGFVPYGSGFGSAMPQGQSGDVYRACSMALSISLTSSLGRYTSDRMLRAMACGCPTLVKRFDDMEGMGLVDGVNCLGWDTTEELVGVARSWLADDRRQDLLRLGAAGADLMKTHHTWDVRMQELAAIVNILRNQQ